MSLVLTIVQSSPHSPEAQPLLDTLSAELKQRFGSDGRDSFGDWRESDPRDYFLLVYADGEPIACGAVRAMLEGVGEIKRMYVRDRRRGIGTMLLRALEAGASPRGYRSLWLETRVANREAVAFYTGNAYVRRANYGKYVGNNAAICFEKDLGGNSAA
jgi:ribosomal protein S18 acetylase RimI-like enzyme